MLIGNTGGDRLIDWVGEWNSYIVPFAAFGIAAVSRQVEPQLPEFLYAISASHGADPTRDSDTGASSARNGEYEGEMGLIIQQDHGLWQEQTGGPTDPQPGNIPGGSRDVLRSADFNGGGNVSQSGFAVDSGAWEIKQGRLSVAAASLGKDAAAVFYVDQYLPIYYEVQAQIKAQKPTAGWKANAYVIFDYFSPTDFKFAGINVSTNKIEMGQRTEAGWQVLVQSTTPVQIKPDVFYTVLVAINGTNVSVLVDNRSYFTHTFAPRVIEGVAVGLNGFVFDRYGPNDFEWVAIDAATDQVLLGHTTSRGGWVVDKVVSRQIDANVDYTVSVVLTGTGISVSLNGALALSHGFNAAIVDGRFGLFARGGAATFDDVTVKTNDPAFEAAPQLLLASSAPDAGAATLQSVTDADVQSLLDEALARYASETGEPMAGDVQVQVADLPGLALGMFAEGIVYIDADAAGWGWFVDATPQDDREFDALGRALPSRDADGRMDLLSALLHALGHAGGHAHDAHGWMAGTLSAGLRVTPALHPSAHAAQAQASTSARAWGHDWLQRFVNQAGMEASRINPNAKLQVSLPVSRLSARRRIRGGARRGGRAARVARGGGAQRPPRSWPACSAASTAAFSASTSTGLAR